MPLASPRGPKWGVRNPLVARNSPSKRGVLGYLTDVLKRVFGRARQGRTGFGDEPDGDGTCGAGDRSPLLPRTPVLVGAAAKQLPKVESSAEEWALDGGRTPSSF